MKAQWTKDGWVGDMDEKNAADGWAMLDNVPYQVAHSIWSGQADSACAKALLGIWDQLRQMNERLAKEEA